MYSSGHARNIQSGGYYEQRSAHGTRQHKYERRDSHTTNNAKKRSLKISDYFSKQNGKPSLSGE